MKKSSEKSLESIAHQLHAMLSVQFPGIRVQAEPTSRWNRPCVTFTCAAFAQLLPEERFHRLVAVIPAEFREQEMAGMVWVELADGETLDHFFKMPRSEDVASREKEIFRDLAKLKLFDALTEAMGPAPERRCKNDFRKMIEVLSNSKASTDQLRDAKLLMIRHRAFCDCQVLVTAAPELAKLNQERGFTTKVTKNTKQ